MTRHSYLDFFEASVIIGGIIALILMIITVLDKPEALVGRVFIVSLDRIEGIKREMDVTLTRHYTSQN